MKQYATYLFCFAIMFYTDHVAAQWCIPETAIPYAPSMPGITHVKLNTIDRTSADLEDYPNNSYVYAEETTTLQKGVNYEMTIGFTVDAVICPDMNLRVWIDLDHNGSFEDIGETVLSADHVDPNEYTDEFYLPDYTLPGITRMRVTAKMTSLGGHSLPTPCDIPHDPLGYHGEFEDYDITITDATAIDGIQNNGMHASITPNPSSGAFDISWQTETPEEATITITSLSGEMISQIISEEGVTDNTIQFTENQYALTPGYYLVTVTTGMHVQHMKLIII